jgi:NAD(P)-dependent dehydrogenase (short-subunit alcohol dehydrogenase family)
MATPEEAGSAILFLMTNEFLTGTVLHLDGGRMLVN